MMLLTVLFIILALPVTIFIEPARKTPGFSYGDGSAVPCVVGWGGRETLDSEGALARRKPRHFNGRG